MAESNMILCWSIIAFKGMTGGMTLNSYFIQHASLYQNPQIHNINPQFHIHCLFTFDIKITSSFFLAASATANSADCQARPMTDIEMENGWQAMCLAMDLDKNM